MLPESVSHIPVATDPAIFSMSSPMSILNIRARMKKHNIVRYATSCPEPALLTHL